MLIPARIDPPIGTRDVLFGDLCRLLLGATMWPMNTFTVVAAGYTGFHEVQAATLRPAGVENVQLLDTDGNIVAVVALKNVTVVYKNAQPA